MRDGWEVNVRMRCKESEHVLRMRHSCLSVAIRLEAIFALLESRDESSLAGFAIATKDFEAKRGGGRK